MSRNTNIEPLMFPVELKPVYLKEKRYNKLSNFSAVTANIDGEEKVYSVVSGGYTLVMNKDALAFGKEIFREMFPNSNDDDFIVFNVISPLSKSYCHIDLINRNYTLNICSQEVYVPFIRITNSYNKSRKLKFELGFCREVCDNGVIFEREFVSLNFNHFKNEISSRKILKIKDMNYEKLKSAEQSFINYMENLYNIKIEEKYFIPVTAEILRLKFKKEDVSERYYKIIDKQKEEFVTIMEKLKAKYTAELGETAYSLFNTVTALANEKVFVKNIRYNDYQIKAGEWVKKIVRMNEEEQIQKYLDDCVKNLN